MHGIVYTSGKSDKDPDVASVETSPAIDDVMDVAPQKHGGAHEYTSGELSEVIDSCNSSVSTNVEPPGLAEMASHIKGQLADKRQQIIDDFKEEIGDVNDILFVAPPTPEGSSVPVSMACALGLVIAGMCLEVLLANYTRAASPF